MSWKESERDVKNILMLKSLNIYPVNIQSLDDARKIPELEGYDLKEKYFELVCCRYQRNHSSALLRRELAVFSNES